MTHKAICEFAYESDDNASFLVICGNFMTLGYQVSMLENNRISNVLAVDVVRKDDICYLYYNITSKTSLSLFLNIRKLDRNDFLKLLLKIVSAVDDSSGYLLTSSNFVFNLDYVYVDPETLEPAIIYVPACDCVVDGTVLTEFISELVIKHINIAGFENSNAVQRILASVKSEVFNIKGFAALLTELLYGQEGPIDGALETSQSDEEEEKLESRRGNVREIGVRGVGRRRKASEIGIGGGKRKISEIGSGCEGGSERENVSIQNANIGSGSNGVKEINCDEDSEDVTGKRENKPVSNSLVAVIAVLVQIIIASVIYLNRNFLNKVGDNPATTYLAVAIVVLALEVLLFKKLNEVRLINISDTNIKSETVKQPLLNQVNQASSTTLTSQTDSMNPRDQACTAGKFSGKTELLKAHKKGTRMLKSDGNLSRVEDILIDKDEFIIGRLEGYVDYELRNSAVGKLHAQLLYKNGISYVKDLNSVNGTFINNKRLESNKEYELKGNDRLQLANCEFIYMC